MPVSGVFFFLEVCFPLSLSFSSLEKKNAHAHTQKLVQTKKTNLNRVVQRLPRHLSKGLLARQGPPRRPGPCQTQLRRQQAARKDPRRQGAAVVRALPRRRRQARPLHCGPREGGCAEGEGGEVRRPAVLFERQDRRVRAISGAEGAAGEAASGESGREQVGFLPPPRLLLLLPLLLSAPAPSPSPSSPSFHPRPPVVIASLFSLFET